MEQVISPPDEEWLTYIAKMWLLGSQISEEINGEGMDGGHRDLDRIQNILDSDQIAATSTQKLQSLGIVFGRVFINETPGYDWWVVADEYGKDACIRYKETTLLLFPQTLISKRIQDGEEINVRQLFLSISERLNDIRKESH